MPPKGERDPVAGPPTTGCEGDGRQERNAPRSRWRLYASYACIACALMLFLLYPSIPDFSGHDDGLLGYSPGTVANAGGHAIATHLAVNMQRIKVLSFDEIRKDPELMRVALTDGRITFTKNCQPCHGAGGGGNPGYPALADGNWMWGGTLKDIQRTVTHGIRTDDPDARQSQMPTFGVGGILKPEQIQHIADYVMTLFGRPAKTIDVSAGRKLFVENCAVCHGEQGQGNRQIGVPRLASRVHLRVSDRDSVVRQITNPVMGVMPNWHHRLDAAAIKSVTIYVHSLGGGK